MQVDIEKVFKNVDSFLDDVTKTLDPQLLGWLQKYAEMHVAMFAGEAIKDLKVSLVLDTNFAMQAITYYAKGRTPMLLKLAKNPMFPIYAPPELAVEVEEKIELFTAKGLNRSKMQEAWTLLRKVVTFTPIRNTAARRRAAELIGMKDGDDISFVQIYIETGAAGILTSDRHFDHDAIRKFDLGRLQSMVAMVHRGVYSFFVVHNLVPTFLALLGKMVLAIARAVFRILVELARIAAGAIVGAIKVVAELLDKLPDAVKIILGIAALAATIIALAWEKSREKIVGFFKDLLEVIGPVLKRLAEWFRNAAEIAMNVAKASSPYALISLAVASKFYQNVIEMTEELMRISAAAA